MQRQVCPPNESDPTPIKNLDRVACQFITPLLADDVAAFKKVYFNYPSCLAYQFTDLPGIEADFNYLIFAAIDKGAYYCLEFMIDKLIETENSQLLSSMHTNDGSGLLLTLLRYHETKSATRFENKTAKLKNTTLFFPPDGQSTLEVEINNIKILITRVLHTPDIKNILCNNKNETISHFMTYLPNDIQKIIKQLIQLDYLKTSRSDRTSFFSLLPRDITEYVLEPYIRDKTMGETENINAYNTHEISLRLPKKDDLYRHIWR